MLKLLSVMHHPVLDGIEHLYIIGIISPPLTGESLLMYFYTSLNRSVNMVTLLLPKL